MKFKERDTSKPAEQQGIFRKFQVSRVDGSDVVGGKHFGCRYFVLDMDHDAHALAALRAYADSCASTHPELASDLRLEFGEAERTTAPVSLADAQIREIFMANGFTIKEGQTDLKPYVYAAARALLAAAPAPIQKEPVKGEPEAHKLARILWNMVEAVEDYDGPEIYRDGYQSADGDVFVHRAGHLLVEQQAEIAELTRYVDSFGSQLAELKAATPPALAGSQVQAAVDVLAERERQKQQEGWTPEHDDQYTQCELPVAAACYALEDGKKYAEPPILWPWAPSWWKPTTYRRNLIKAGALILAEIERLDRAAMREQP